jgi:hypothetical protein
VQDTLRVDLQRLPLPLIICGLSTVESTSTRK